MPATGTLRRVPGHDGRQRRLRAPSGTARQAVPHRPRGDRALGQRRVRPRGPRGDRPPAFGRGGPGGRASPV